ncbi:unnamed protein product, partial [Didymodactylos carnosus]
MMSNSPSQQILDHIEQVISMLTFELENNRRLTQTVSNDILCSNFATTISSNVKVSATDRCSQSSFDSKHHQYLTPFVTMNNGPTSFSVPSCFHHRSGSPTNDQNLIIFDKEHQSKTSSPPISSEIATTTNFISNCSVDKTVEELPKNENILIDGFRPPAVPLIVFSPHMSVWSPSNNLTDSYSAHWSGKQMDFVGMIRIDNITYRFMGSDQVKAPPMQQTQVIVNPWRTVYTFQSAGVQLTLAFSQPPALDDPYTYISFYLQSVDQKKHEAQLYFDMSAYIPINDPNEKVDWYDDLSSINSTQILTMFSFDQIAFRIRGDSEKNNWGYAHLIYDGREYPYTKTQASGQTSRQSFIDGQPLPANDKRKPRSASDNSSVSAYVINFGNVTGEQVESFLTFAYDDTYSMYYFNDYQVPYWRSQKNITMLANEAIRRYSTSMEDVSVLDSLVIQLLNKTAGEKYATLLSLVIRQITGAMTVTWSEKFQTTFLFMKEISSDGKR